MEIPTYGAPELQNEDGVLHEFDLPENTAASNTAAETGDNAAEAANVQQNRPRLAVRQTRVRKGKLTLLKEQINIQKDLKHYMKKISTDLHEKNKILKNIEIVQEKRYLFEKKKFEITEKRKNIELKLKVEDIEYKKKKMELENLKFNVQFN